MVWGSKLAWVLALWLSLVMLEGDGAQVGAPSPSPSPSMDCSSAILSLADCLTFVEQGSKVTKPQGQCCSALKKVVKEEVACLCEAFKQSSNFGVSINVTKALTLPSACGVSTPPFSKCKIAGAPGVSPAPSPSSGAPSGSAGASTAPASSPAHSGAGALSAPSFVIVLAAASVALSFYYI